MQLSRSRTGRLQVPNSKVYGSTVFLLVYGSSPCELKLYFKSLYYNTLGIMFIVQVLAY